MWWPNIVDRIATFALAVPLLPEIASMPIPFGFRRAARRALRPTTLSVLLYSSPTPSPALPPLLD